MNSELANSLSVFATNVNNLIPVSQILAVIGIALGSGFSIYIVVWGAKKIIRAVSNAINGYWTSERAYYNAISYNSNWSMRKKDKWARKNGYSGWWDFEAQQRMEDDGLFSGVGGGYYSNYSDDVDSDYYDY